VEAYARVEELRPAVAVFDVGMPRMTGIEAAFMIRNAGLATAVLFVSVHRERAFVRAAIGAGARGYVFKESAPVELLDAIRTVAAGGTFFSTQADGAAKDP
jgi:DNA-binding NarL/FixJ family response regulator